MTDQHLNSETNQEKEGMHEESIQPPMTDQGLENADQPPMMAQGTENPVQPPIVEQDQQKPVPTSGILTLAFYLALGYLGILLLSAIALGPWGLLFLFIIWLHILCFIIATVLLRNGKNKGDKTTLGVSIILYFFSVIAANDPKWHFNMFITLLMAGMVFIGTLLLPNE